MSLVGGSVSVGVDSNGQPVFAGNGLALEWARGTVTAALATLPPLPQVGDTSPPYRPEQPVSAQDRQHAINARKTLFEDKARDANAIAPVLVAYLTANAELRLNGVLAKVENVSVGRTPNPLAVDTAIKPPTSAVFLPVEGQGGIR
jgi:hypothetical protein